MTVILNDNDEEYVMNNLFGGEPLLAKRERNFHSRPPNCTSPALALHTKLHPPPPPAPHLPVPHPFTKLRKFQLEDLKNSQQLPKNLMKTLPPRSLRFSEKEAADQAARMPTTRSRSRLGRIQVTMPPTSWLFRFWGLRSLGYGALH